MQAILSIVATLEAFFGLMMSYFKSEMDPVSDRLALEATALILQLTQMHRREFRLDVGMQ